MLEDDKLPVGSGRFAPESRYPNPLEDTEVDGVDITPGRMLEDDIPPVSSRRFRYPNPLGDTPEVDGVDVTPGWMFEDDIPPVDSRRFTPETNCPNPLPETPG
jgi:hypothetical protein